MDYRLSPLLPKVRKQRAQSLLHLLLLLFLALAVRPAAAQSYGSALADTTKVFSFVEQMPALPGGGGNAAIVAAIMHFFSPQSMTKPEVVP